jgi:hypothetical protein
MMISWFLLVREVEQQVGERVDHVARLGRLVLNELQGWVLRWLVPLGHKRLRSTSGAAGTA